VKDNLGAMSNVATLAISVQSPPVASNDAATTVSNQSVTLDVTANDSSAGGTIDPATVAIVTAPAHGDVAINNGDHTVTFTPATAYVGADTFQYTIEDNLGAPSNVATVTITVTEASSHGGNGGGGAIDWLMLIALGSLVATLRRAARVAAD
jgi:hypothetical protein